MELHNKSKFEDAQERNAKEWPTNRQDQHRTSRASSTQEGLAMSLQKQGDSKSRDEDDETFASDLEDTAEAGSSPQTAMERRAQPRNMKRFRLTHNQTRYLMAEFARQPHPDAAQQERLSRDVPGLRSRQVQIWFQNRRAKLKRLSAADREQMVKSRAVPEDFDRSSTLYSTLPLPHQPDINSTTQPSSGYTEVISEITGAPGFGHRRDISGETLSGSAHSAYSEPLWAPDSVASSQNNSSVPPGDERSHHTSSPAFHLHTPTQGTPYARSRSFRAIYSTSPDPRNRIRAESLASPPSPAFTGAGPTRRRSSQTRVTSARSASPALLDPPWQSQMRSPFHGRLDYTLPSREPPRNRSRSDLAPDPQLQQAQHSACELSDYSSSAYPTFGNPQRLHQPSVGSPMFQFDPTTREIPSATSIPSSVYPWSASTEPNARAFPSVPYSTPHTSQAQYIALEGAIDDTENSRARQDVRETPVVGLRLPQQVFTP